MISNIFFVEFPACCKRTLVPNASNRKWHITVETQNVPSCPDLSLDFKMCEICFYLQDQVDTENPCYNQFHG